MKRFQDRVYALSEKGLLVWEPSWETFRPVESVVWNPTHNQIEPFFGLYTHDIFDVHYGYRTAELHDFCVDFTDKFAYDVGGADPVDDVHEFWRWCKVPCTWIQDRPMAVHPCAASTPERKRFLERYNLRSRTCRAAPRNLRGTLRVSKHK